MTYNLLVKVRRVNVGRAGFQNRLLFVDTGFVVCHLLLARNFLGSKAGQRRGNIFRFSGLFIRVSTRNSKETGH